ncbi:ADP-forming succinate--CoA ligase subunit beta [bacterium]|nr:ADP-forming succinate--CoA ligase subunit beta [candidate division CSSED10-310 bacterium]
MKIHEYQAKNLMKQFGIPVMDSRVAESMDDGIAIVQDMFDSGIKRMFIKAQIHAGGRGKAGGIAEIRSMDDAVKALNRILGMRLVNNQTGPEGKIVHKVMIVEADRAIVQELYAGIILDREHELPLLLVSAKGGVDIEELAVKHPEAILRQSIDPWLGLMDFQARNLAVDLGLTGKTVDFAIRTFTGMYHMFMNLDCSQIEINPLAIDPDSNMFALDAKVALDESAFFKHPELKLLHDPLEESPLEIWAAKNKLNYVKLDGEIGCMVNGAGLAMATMDTINHFRGKPANFLDVGGGANTETITEAFKILLSDNSVRAVLINIFGGIVRCDRVAEGIIRAAQDSAIDRPLVIRLAGTNAAQGMDLLRRSGLSLETACCLDEAAERVVALANEGVNR